MYGFSLFDVGCRLEGREIGMTMGYIKACWKKVPHLRFNLVG